MGILETLFKKKIAVLEKDLDQYALYKRILEKRVSCRLDLIDSYENLDLSKYDMLISDLELNDNFDILSFLDEKNLKIPVLIIANDSIKLDIEKIDKLSNYFLTKHDCLFHLSPKVKQLLIKDKKIDNIKKIA